MRLGQRLTTVAMVIFLGLQGSQASGQGMPVMQTGHPIPAGPASYGMPMPMTGGYAPAPGIHGGTSPISYGGIPDSMQPWPGISPYMDNFRHHVNQGGWWYQITNRWQPRYFLNVDYAKVKTKKLNGLVGNPNAQSYHEMVFDDLVGATDQQYALDFEPFNYFNPVDASAAGNPESHGLNLNGGWWNPDDSGFFVNVLWTGRGTSEYNAREFATRNFRDFGAQNVTGIGQDEGVVPMGASIQPVFVRNERAMAEAVLSPPNFLLTDIGNVDPTILLQRSLLNLSGIPVGDGTFAGVTIPYDLEFRVRNVSESFGTNVGMVFAPLIRSENLTVRPVVGGRYLYTDNQFQFYGVDSGTIYDENTNLNAEGRPNFKLHSHPNGRDDDDDGITDNAGIAEDENTTVGLRLINFNTDFSTIINSHTINQVRSHLAGPEAGLRYDVGGERLKIWGQTKFGLLLNNETLKLSGDNIGLGTDIVPGTFILPTRTNSFADPASFNIPTAANPNPNRFSDSAKNTHVSPMIEQTLQAEFPIFRSIPILRDWYVLENATFRVGGTFTWINNMASPVQSIVWRGHPQRGLFPTINVEREDWWILSTNAGIGWSF